MIDWLREKFASAISVLYYIWVIGSIILGGLYGYIIGKMLSSWNFNWAGIGCFLGLVFGLIFGIISGILIYGFSATVIHIAETNDQILLKIYELPNIGKKSINVTSADFSTKQNDIFVNNSSSTELSEKTATEKSSGNTVQSNVWVCTKCGTTNPVGSVLCQNCGH